MAERTVPRPRGRRLSRRRCKALAEIGSWWEDSHGRGWRLARRFPGDGLVRLERPGDGYRMVTYGELASQYRLLDGDGGA